MTPKASSASSSRSHALGDCASAQELSFIGQTRLGDPWEHGGPLEPGIPRSEDTGALPRTLSCGYKRPGAEWEHGRGAGHQRAYLTFQESRSELPFCRG